MSWLVTAYCVCKLCTGDGDGITATGTIAAVGRTVACDKQYKGQVIFIDSVGYRICEDTGSMIKGDHVDLFMETHEQALKWGRKLLKVLFPDNEAMKKAAWREFIRQEMDKHPVEKDPSIVDERVIVDEYASLKSADLPRITPVVRPTSKTRR